MKSMPVIFKSAALFKEKDLKKSDFSGYRILPEMDKISDEQIASRILTIEAQYPNLRNNQSTKMAINSLLDELHSEHQIKGKQ